MTSELNSIMNEAGDQSSEGSDIKWSVMDNCVVKHGKNWVRAIIEELKPDHDRCRVSSCTSYIPAEIFADSSHLSMHINCS